MYLLKFHASMVETKIERIGEKKYGTANMFILPERNYSTNPGNFSRNKLLLSARSSAK